MGLVEVEAVEPIEAQIEVTVVEAGEEWFEVEIMIVEVEETVATIEVVTEGVISIRIDKIKIETKIKKK